MLMLGVAISDNAQSGVTYNHYAGLNYVSCSPFRVPIARLAAAHAALTGK